MDIDHRLKGALLLLVLGALGAVLASGCTPQRASAAAAAGAAATAEDGKRLFQANCVQCHGDKGDRVPVSPLQSKDFLDSRGDATLVAAVADGKGVMPAYGKARGGPFSDDEVRAVVAYMSVYAGRQTTTLTAGQGRALYQQGCVNCHGDKGDRIPVAPLSAKPFIDSRTDAQLAEVISDGRDLMPGVRKGAKQPMTEDQVKSIVAYLRFGAESHLADQARQGRELYVSTCLVCHGERGDRVSGIALASAEYLKRLGDGGVLFAIGDGKGTMPGSSRAKGGALDVPDMATVLIYLKSWAGLPAGSALTGFEKPGEGRDIFARNCAACHGEGGDRVPGVRLKSSDFLNQRTDDELQRAVAQGNARGMPAWGKAAGGPLADDDVKGIVAYLRSVATAPGAAGQPAAKPTAAAPAAGAAMQTSAPQTTAPRAAPPQTTALAAPAGDLAKGKELVAAKGCGGCHTIPGVAGAVGAIGPNLSDVGGKTKIAGGAVEVKGSEDFKKWVLDPPALKPGTAMPKLGLTDAEATDIAAFLSSLGGASAPTSAPAAAPVGGAATAPAAPAAQTNPPAKGDPAKGKELIAGKGCGGCHTIPGVAGANGAVGPNLQDVGSKSKIAGGAVDVKSQDDLKKWVMDPPSLKPGTAMPKLGLTDAEATDIAAFLRSLGGGGASAPNPVAAGSGGASAPPPASTAPLDPLDPMVDVNAVIGKELFTKNCVACHGEDGLRQQNCPLGNFEWLANTPTESLMAKISNGKPSAGMPTWSKRRGGSLSDSQIAATMAYLRALARQNAGLGDRD